MAQYQSCDLKLAFGDAAPAHNYVHADPDRRAWADLGSSASESPSRNYATQWPADTHGAALDQPNSQGSLYSVATQGAQSQSQGWRTARFKMLLILSAVSLAVSVAALIGALLYGMLWTATKACGPHSTASLPSLPAAAWRYLEH